MSKCLTRRQFPDKARVTALVLLVVGCRPAPPAPATIEDIQYAAVAVDLDKANLREDMRAVDNPAGGGTIVSRFRTGRKLRKVLARVYNDAGQAQHVFYLHNDIPFLLVSRFIWFDDPFNRQVSHMLTDSLYYAHGKLLRSMSIDSPAVSPMERRLSTPLDSVTDRLQKFLALEPTR